MELKTNERISLEDWIIERYKKDNPNLTEYLELDGKRQYSYKQGLCMKVATRVNIILNDIAYLDGVRFINLRLYNRKIYDCIKGTKQYKRRIKEAYRRINNELNELYIQNEQLQSDYYDIEKHLENNTCDFKQKSKMEKKKISILNESEKIQNRIEYLCQALYNDEIMLTGKKHNYPTDISVAEKEFFNFLLDHIGNSKKSDVPCNLSKIKKGEWEVLPVDERQRIIDSIEFLCEKNIWRLDESHIEYVKFKLENPHLYRCKIELFTFTELLEQYISAEQGHEELLDTVAKKLKRVNKDISEIYEPIFDITESVNEILECYQNRNDEK